MKHYYGFENLDVWKVSKQLVIYDLIYKDSLLMTKYREYLMKQIK